MKSVIAEKIVSVVTQVCKETKLWICPNLQQPNSSFTYSFKFTYFCIVDIWTLKKGILLKKIKNHWQSLKLDQKIKMFRLSSKNFNV